MLFVIAKAFLIKELAEYQSRVILIVDKGVAMVVLDKQDYINKAHDLHKRTHTEPSQQTPLTNTKVTYQHTQDFHGAMWN